MAANEKYLTSSDIVFWVSYNSTTFAECNAANARGARIMLAYTDGNAQVEMTGEYSVSAKGAFWIFTGFEDTTLLTTHLGSNDSWGGITSYGIDQRSATMLSTDYNSHDAGPSAYYLYHYSTGCTMPHAEFLTNGLYVCNGNLIAETGVTATTTWTVTFSTFYQKFMKSLGAFNYATSGATGTDAISAMRPYFSDISFMRCRTGSTSVYRTQYASLSGTTQITAYSGSTVGITASTSNVSIKMPT